MAQDKKPLILVTNDDGVNAKGINALIEEIKSLGDVVVVAPNQSNSGMSQAITVKTPLFLSLVSQTEGVTIYKSNGTPADCIKLALHQLKVKPDYIVSGINHGTNSSISYHYSGTMGGAKEGAINHIPSIGFSLTDYNGDADFSFAVTYVKHILTQVMKTGIPEGICLNVNIPAIQNIQGVKICRQAKGKWIEKFLEREDPMKRKYYWLTGEFKNEEPDACDTDEYYINKGFVSVVPCKIDATAYGSLEYFSDLEL